MKFRKITFFSISTIFAVLILLTGCSSGSDSHPTNPVTDADGDILSSRTTGIRLPQSIQTIPANNSASLKKKYEIPGEVAR